MSNAEKLRRVRLSDHRTYLRKRYGYELPPGDDGREDLYEMLLTVSLGDGADRKMRQAIELWAPWMGDDEAEQIIDRINQTPDYQRKRTKRDLGKRWNLTYDERLAWGIRTVDPCDISEEEFLRRRKERKNFLALKRRLAAGRMTRAKYRDSFANSLSRTKPWEAEGKSRAKWYRERASGSETRCEANKASLLQATNPVSQSKSLEGRKRTVVEGRVRKKRSKAA
jgi:hypothetical protein